jgi:RNA polymerase sigma-70 factor (ECF subfamily)
MKLAAVPSSSRRPLSITDPELMRALASSEDLAPLGALFDRYQEDVRQFLRRASSNGADVDDLVQETFLTVARAAGSYDGRPSARPFVIGVAAQLLRRRRRSFARLCNALQGLGSAELPPSRTPEDATAEAQEQATLHAALGKLSDDKRLLLAMVEWEGMSGEAAARSLGIPVGTVWRRLHEARGELRKRLTRTNAASRRLAGRAA